MKSSFRDALDYVKFLQNNMDNEHACSETILLTFKYKGTQYTTVKYYADYTYAGIYFYTEDYQYYIGECRNITEIYDLLRALLRGDYRNEARSEIC